MKRNITDKLIKVTGITALTLCSFFLKANNGGTVMNETEKTIREHVTFPNLILPIEKNEKVEVVFTTTESGKVNFVLAKTSNEILKKEIEKKFLSLTLSKLKANVAHSIVFNFKTI